MRSEHLLYCAVGLLFLGAYWILKTRLALRLDRRRGKTFAERHWWQSAVRNADGNLHDAKCLMVGASAAIVISMLVPYYPIALALSCIAMWYVFRSWPRRPTGSEDET